MAKQKNKYLNSKAQNKRKAMKGVWLLLVAAGIFVFILLKYARNSAMQIGDRRMPEKEDAYSMAKNFVLDDSKDKNLDFGDDGYSFAKTGDSVFVIKSTYLQPVEGGDKKKTSFEVTLRYKGGPVDDQNAWDLLNINKD